MKVFLAIHDNEISDSVADAIAHRYSSADVMKAQDHILNSTEIKWASIGEEARRDWFRQAFEYAKECGCFAVILMDWLVPYAGHSKGGYQDAFDPELVVLRSTILPGPQLCEISNMLDKLEGVIARHQILRNLPERHASQGSLRWVAHELATRWGSSAYSEAYNARKDPQRDAHHALLHITKAVGKVASELDALDHGSPASAETVEKALADIVICATRVASVWPGGLKSIAVAVALRIAEKFPEKV